MANQESQSLQSVTRRHFLRDCGLQIGTIALASLLGDSAAIAQSPNHPITQSPDPLTPKPSHFAPKAKRVIFLFMAGGPSHLDLFDPKPLLQKYHGQPLPPSIIGNQRYAFIQRNAAVLGSPFKFAKHGQSGAQLSAVLPWLSDIAAD